MSLPPYIDRETIHKRLKIIFPEGVPQRTYCTREAAASTIFAMLYIGAVEGHDQWIAPKQIYRMTDAQAAIDDDMSRLRYAKDSTIPRFKAPGDNWYQDNSREQIRDETLRQGLITNNAVIEKAGVPTTSGKGRYALRADFAALFAPSLIGDALETAAAAWLSRNLSASALARTAFLRQGVVPSDADVLVTFPSKETRRLAAGPSSVITKAVIEEFAQRFLVTPAVLWVSESRKKVVTRDDELAATLGLKITSERVLPDIVLVDLSAGDTEHFLIVFIEVVATDGPVTTERQKALLEIATKAGFPADRIAFVTAYSDRASSAFKKTIPEVAWRSFAWFAAEPEQIMLLHDGATSPLPLGKLLQG